MKLKVNIHRALIIMIFIQIFADSGTLYLVFCGLAILLLIENRTSQAVHYLIAAQVCS